MSLRTVTFIFALWILTVLFFNYLDLRNNMVNSHEFSLQFDYHRKNRAKSDVHEISPNPNEYKAIKEPTFFEKILGNWISY